MNVVWQQTWSELDNDILCVEWRTGLMARAVDSNFQMLGVVDGVSRLDTETDEPAPEGRFRGRLMVFLWPDKNGITNRDVLPLVTGEDVSHDDPDYFFNNLAHTKAAVEERLASILHPTAD